MVILWRLLKQKVDFYYNLWYNRKDDLYLFNEEK